MESVRVVYCFFFQAEDGIRDRNVTGVQTCALPIWEPSDVVLVDIFMPGQGGLQTIDRLRRGSPQARIIAMSGATSVGALDVKGHALAMGADRFLEKPFEPATLVTLIAALL